MPKPTGFTNEEECIKDWVVSTLKINWTRSPQEPSWSYIL